MGCSGGVEFLGYRIGRGFELFEEGRGDSEIINTSKRLDLASLDRWRVRQ